MTTVCFSSGFSWVSLGLVIGLETGKRYIYESGLLLQDCCFSRINVSVSME